ncbi:hypothetical protein EDD15DRAFT_2363138 [Pisolithus albus]|nr:hypothetical protein EDD15DRAFT_2363138 [Pisolithus albus]
MDIPELAADGRNWQTYGGWVLEAVAEDGLKGYLDGSEERPMYPEVLHSVGDGSAPHTGEERDSVRAWQAADAVWQQRAAEAHYLIICGIPDSILMLCMHLEDPHDVFSYLENRYGRIPRPAGWKAAGEAIQPRVAQPEQCVTSETAQMTGESENRPDDPPSGHLDALACPSDWTEVTNGCQVPETEAEGMQLAEDGLPPADVVGTAEEMPSDQHPRQTWQEASDWHGQPVGVRATVGGDEPKSIDLVMASGCTSSVLGALSAESSECWVSEAASGQNTPASGTEALEQVGTKGPCVEDLGTKLGDHLEERDSRCAWLESHGTPVIPWNLPGMVSQPEEVEGRDGNATSSSTICSCRGEKTLLASSGSQHSGYRVLVEWLNGLPAPPEPPPNYTKYLPRLYKVSHRRGRVKMRAEAVSDTSTRWEGYRVRVGTMQPLQLVWMSVGSHKTSVGQTRIVRVLYSKVSGARSTETRASRGHWHGNQTHASAGAKQPLRRVSKRLKPPWNATSRYWWQGVPPRSTPVSTILPNGRAAVS